MAEIKVGLKELWDGFKESAANEELDMPSRKLASRMCVAVAHISRVEGLVHAAAKSLSERVMAAVNTRLAKFVEELGAELAGITTPDAAPGVPDVPVGESPAVEGEPAKPAAKAAGLPQTTPPAPMPRGKGRKAPAPPKVEAEEDPEANATIDSMLADTEAEIRAIEAQAGKPALRTVPAAPTGGNAS